MSALCSVHPTCVSPSLSDVHTHKRTHNQSILQSVSGRAVTQSSAWGRGRPDSLPGQTVWDFWCTTWQPDRFFNASYGSA